MKWQLTEPHHLDEQVLPAGTIIGDDTAHPYRAPKDDPKIGRKLGDALPPSTNMIPMDDEARKAYDKHFKGQVPSGDPTASIPLTGAPDAPRVAVVRPQPQVAGPNEQKPVNPAPKDDAPKTGMAHQPNPPADAKPPADHDSSKNPGDSKDTVTAKAPDVKKI